jgi:hypothetical protein
MAGEKPPGFGKFPMGEVPTLSSVSLGQRETDLCKSRQIQVIFGTI